MLQGSTISTGAPFVGDGDGIQDELERRLRQQALLAELGRRALENSDTDVMLQEAARLCALGLSVNYCKIMEYLPDQNRLLVRAGVGWHEGVVGHATVGADLASPAGYALHTGKPVITNHLSDEDRFRTPALLTAHGIERAVNVILLGETRPYGVLEVDSEAPGTFTEHDIDFLQGAANLLGLALARRRTMDELRLLNETLESRVEVEVAERRQVEDALRQAQKMEAVGRLTGGVAHDFNNLLQVISGTLALMAPQLGGNERLTRFVDTAQKAAAKGAQLTAQLLTFARKQTLRPQTRPINELVAEFDVLAMRILGETIEVEFALAQDAGQCHVDPAQFGSALLNIVVNAKDAMPSGGRLAIRSINVALTAREAARYIDAVPGSYVMVEITDTGEGMPPEVLERATEPFYTTKEVGKGTGLGLSQVYGFVRQSNGFIVIESKLGVGTAVRIYLPQVGATEAQTAGSGETVAGIRGGTVLVVEDDPSVRDLAVMQLDDLGYTTVSAGSGPEALNMLAEAGRPKIDLVLTDMIMPGGMTGIELARAVQAHWPDIKVIIASGYTAGADTAPDLTDGRGTNFPLISKPYSQADLARVLQAALL
jgi:signal transduction histidine kinase/ActR/RegA family two-component response regulator